jgi:AraC-like DNA-binding protein
MQKLTGPTSGVPMMRLNLLVPWIKELKRRHVDYIELLELVGLPNEQSRAADLFVASNALYRFVDLAARVADDPYLGATIGYKLELTDLPQISAASEPAVTVGDLLIRIAIISEHHQTSLRMGLQVESHQATFNFVRLFKPDVSPAHIDAYYIGVLINVLKAALPSRWSARQVRAKVCDPQAIPPDLGGLTVIQGDRTTASLTFPSQWLFERVHTRVRELSSGFTQDMPPPPKTLIESLKVALRPHIHQTDLTVERSAEICGFEKRRLSRHLKQKGTTLAKLIASIREEEAAKELSATNRRIGDIALSVGFKDPTVFSRAFKNWTGQSPQEFRRSHH